MMIFAMNKGLSSVMNLLQYQAFRGSSESFLLCWRAGKQGIKLLHGNLACSSLHHTPDNTPHHMTQKPVCSDRSEEHTSELQSRGHLVCRLLLEKKQSKDLR